MVGKVIVSFAIGLSAVIVFCMLFVFSAGVTALFGGVPMAALVIILGGGMVFAGVRGRRQLSLWLLTAAIAVTLPMAAVSIADLRVEGSYGDINETPLTMVDIPDDGFKMAAGDMTIDLRKFDFDRQRELQLPVESGMGLTSIVVPDNVCVTGKVQGKAGVISFRGKESNGIDVSQSTALRTTENGPGKFAHPEVQLDAEFKLGAFEVVDGTQWKRFGNGGSFSEHEGDSDAAQRSARERATAACSEVQAPASERRSS
jgi:predicted membrane protein